ncbi:MAG: hypothetical protein H6670_11310 [Anaerolineaceae bacterium]|nr:hypothetical protein [Anaerolineaceae bacterium]
MKMPIFAYEPNDLSVFSTEEAAEAYIEAIDVLNGEYDYFFDADGYLLDAIVDADSYTPDAIIVEYRPVKLQPVEPPKQDTQALFGILHRHVSHDLAVKGQPTEWLEEATLADLVAWVSENALTY